MPELPENTGSLLTQKAGPLPMWGWGVVILGGAYGVRLYQQHKSGKSDATASTASGYTSATLPSNIQPQYTQVNEGGSQSYVNSPITTIGRQTVDTGAVGVQQGVVAVTAPAPPPPTPGPVPVAAPPPPPGKWLTVVKWNPKQRNAPSTLSGLALQAYGNAGAWQKIWNAPQNASLAARRGDPTKIQPGDRFFAPA